MMAQASVVLDRIRELEDELSIPLVQRYRDPHGTPTPAPGVKLDVDIGDMM